MSAKHILPTVGVLADALSWHFPIQMKWMLRKRVVAEVLWYWCSTEVDMFATRLNNQLPVFVSPVPDRLALEYDVLSMGWTELDIYTFHSSPQQGVDQSCPTTLYKDFDCSTLGSATSFIPSVVTIVVRSAWGLVRKSLQSKSYLHSEVPLSQSINIHTHTFFVK